MVTSTVKSIERRRHTRASMNVGVRCIRLDPHEGGVIDQVDMVDLSRSGVGAVSEKWYYPGQKVVVCLPPDSMHAGRQMRATVKRCLSLNTPGYRLGLEFDHNSLHTWADLDAKALAAA